jgi:hypothetical protein
MAIKCAFDLESRQYDMVNAFTNSELDKPLYSRMPPGFDDHKHILQVNRALYGLRQAPRLWYNLLTEKLEDFGLQAVPDAPCCYTSDKLIIFFYVDDLIMLYAHHHESYARRFERYLCSTFETRTIGPITWFLNIRVVHDRDAGKLHLCQDTYIEKLARRFHINETIKTRPSTPLPTDLHGLPAYDHEQASQASITGYLQKIGSIGFPAYVTRPDIAKAHSILARYNTNPSAYHHNLADRVIQYLVNTKHMALTYTRPTTFEHSIEHFFGATDAAYADHTDRTSSHGYVFKLFGAAIDWKATKQKTITKSTTEAELLALSLISSNVLWWKRFFKHIAFQPNISSTLRILCDNKQAVRIANKADQPLITKMRHVDIHQLWIRQEAEAGRVVIEWIPTINMPADGFTKPLPTDAHRRFMMMLGMTNISSILTSEHTLKHEQKAL